MNPVENAKKKLLFIFVCVMLIVVHKFLGMCQDDNKFMEEHLNSTYVDYNNNPMNYIKTKAEIIGEFESDNGFEISFYGSSEWLVKAVLENGNQIEVNVMRDKDENIGDTIEIAYEKDENYRYVNATRTKYVECWSIAESISILRNVVTIVLVVMIAGGIVIFLKNRMN